LRRTWWTWRFKHHRFILLAFPCALGGEELQAQTSNDNCGFAAGNEYFVSATCNPVDFDKPPGYSNTMSPTSCNAGNFDDAFAWFTGTGNPVVVTYAPPGDRDAVMHVYSGTCAAPVELDCSDNCCNGAVESVTIPTVAATNYFVRIQRYNSDGGMNNGTLCIYDAPPPPANDDPCGATALTVNATCIVTNSTNANATATTGPPAPTCSSYNGGDVWFSATVPANGNLIIDSNTGVLTDGGMALYSAPSCSGPFTQLYCDDDGSTNGWMPLINASGLAPGSTVYIRFWEYGNDNPGSFSICAQSFVPPPAPSCGGMYYDSGGPSLNYANNENYTTVICPPAGQVAGLLFTEFDTEFIDDLTIHDGNSTAAPVIGTYNGNTLPPLILSTDPTGCLTTVFDSDGSVTYPGWAAQVVCQALPAGNCVYVLEMYDNNGNGWGPSSVQYRINGGAWTSYTVTGSANFALIGVNLGDLIELDYVASGPDQGQNSYTISMLGQTPYFTSATPPTAGITWSQTVNCGPPPAPPQDCAGGVTVCNSLNITNSSDNTGWSDDLDASNQGCLFGGENQGTWYFFSPQTDGTIAFSISPANGTDDYDFAVWGPYPNAHCPTEQPLRCSYDAPAPTTTGLNGTATATSEGAFGTGWVQDIDALAGEVYVLYIDDFSLSGQDFTLNWQLSGGSSLDCTVLPLELLSFQARPRGTVIDLAWSTASERNTDLFEVQRSADNHQFTAIGHMDAAGESLQQLDYLFTDPDPLTGANYYRLKLLDLDGTYSYSQVEVAFMDRGQGARPLLFPNPATELLRVAFHAPMEGPATIRIQDAVGRTVATHQAAMARGANAVDIPLLQLADGWYSVAVGLPDGTPLPTGSFLKH
jgi:hypothetical protein